MSDIEGLEKFFTPEEIESIKEIEETVDEIRANGGKPILKQCPETGQMAWHSEGNALIAISAGAEIQNMEEIQEFLDEHPGSKVIIAPPSEDERNS